VRHCLPGRYHHAPWYSIAHVQPDSTSSTSWSKVLNLFPRWNVSESPLRATNIATALITQSIDILSTLINYSRPYCQLAYPAIHLLHKHSIDAFTGTPPQSSCHWLEAPAGSSTENLVSTGGRRYGSTHQCLSIRNPGPLVVEIATTLSRSSAAVTEWMYWRSRLCCNVASICNVCIVAKRCVSPKICPKKQMGNGL